MPVHPDTHDDGNADADEPDDAPDDAGVPMNADDAGRSTADTQAERNRDDESPS